MTVQHVRRQDRQQGLTRRCTWAQHRVEGEGGDGRARSLSRSPQDEAGEGVAAYGYACE